MIQTAFLFIPLCHDSNPPDLDPGLIGPIGVPLGFEFEKRRERSNQFDSQPIEPPTIHTPVQEILANSTGEGGWGRGS